MPSFSSFATSLISWQSPAEPNGLAGVGDGSRMRDEDFGKRRERGDIIDHSSRGRSGYDSDDERSLGVRGDHADSREAVLLQRGKFGAERGDYRQPYSGGGSDRSVDGRGFSARGNRVGGQPTASKRGGTGRW